MMDSYLDGYENDGYYDNNYDEEYDDYNDEYYDEKETYYSERELYPAQRVRRNRENRQNPTTGVQNTGRKELNIDDIRQPQNIQQESNKLRSKYTLKGQEKYINRPSKFETEAEDYNIIEDMKKMQPNILFLQFFKLNSKLSTQVARATRHEKILRE